MKNVPQSIAAFAFLPLAAFARTPAVGPDDAGAGKPAAQTAGGVLNPGISSVIDELFAADDPGGVAGSVRTFFEARSSDESLAPPRIAADGTLENASPRLAVLDRLAKSDSPLSVESAIEISREIAETGSPDERAVAIRNVALLLPADRSWIVENLKGLIEDSADSNFAMAQAMDGIVHLREMSFVPTLAALADDPATARVASVTIDRLASVAPAETARALNAQPELFADRPLVRADFFTKGSLSNPAARVEIERYLARPDVGNAEIEKFARGYLQPGQFVSPGIFTGAPKPRFVEEDRLAGLVAVLPEWKKNFRLSRSVPVLEAVIAEYSGSD